MKGQRLGDHLMIDDDAGAVRFYRTLTPKQIARKMALLRENMNYELLRAMDEVRRMRRKN